LSHCGDGQKPAPAVFLSKVTQAHAHLCASSTRPLLVLSNAFSFSQTNLKNTKSAGLRELNWGNGGYLAKQNLAG
jgi:hypothetical protein